MTGAATAATATPPSARPRPLSWALYLALTPVLFVDAVGAVILAGEAVALRMIGRDDPAPFRRLIGVGLLLRVLFALGWLLFNEHSPVAPLIESPEVIGTTPPEVIRAGLRLVASRALTTLALIAAGVFALRRFIEISDVRARRTTQLALSLAALVALVPAAVTAALAVRDIATPPPRPLWERVHLTPTARPRAPGGGAPHYRRVFLVLMESTSAEAVARAPAGSPARRLRDRAVRFDEVLSASNASHFAQPAILTSHDFSRSPWGAYVRVRPAVQPTLGVADWFSLAGYRTVMVSSQNERWLGMDQIVFSQRWNVAVHSPTFGDPAALYRDACGVTKVLDSQTVERFVREVDRATGPVFGYLNLQNTHFPYLSERGGQPRDFGGLVCEDFASMPADRLELARARHRVAQDEAFARVEALVARYPDALFALVGDHGEEFVEGNAFGHGKTVSMPQIDTFAWFIGPGLSPGDHPQRRSILDVLPSLIDAVSPGAAASLPPGLLAGHTVWTDADDSARTLFTLSGGITPEESAVRGDHQLRVVGTEPRCLRLGARTALRERLPVSECAELESSLRHWRECQATFNADRPGRWAEFFNPCHSLYEGAGAAR